MSRILEVNDLHFKYGEIRALSGISFYVDDSEMVTLLGANGAGKTSTLKAISGLITGIVSGEIRFLGEVINKSLPHAIAAMGLSHCLEGRHIFSQLTVKENLMMGTFLRKGQDYSTELEYVYHLFPRLLERTSQKGGTLSGGEQQMLAVGRALMQKPKLLMMDEPSLGLAPIIIEEIFKAIKRINDDGIPVLLVEQNTNAALQIVDRGYVLETGIIRLHDTAENLLVNEEVKKTYLGLVS